MHNNLKKKTKIYDGFVIHKKYIYKKVEKRLGPFGTVSRGYITGDGISHEARLNNFF